MYGFIRGVFIALVILVVAIAGLWGALALWFQVPGPDPVPLLAAGGFGLLTLLTVLGQFSADRIRYLGLFALALFAVTLWWRTIAPPAQADWSPDVARQVTGTIEGDQLTLTDVRNFEWRTADDFTPNWETRHYDLSTLQGADLFMSYWGAPGIAHMIISFEFENDSYLAWSVEVRRKVTSSYSPVADAFKAHTLVLVAADERDVVGTRTNARGEDVQLYRLTTPVPNARRLLERYVRAANALHENPQWYNSLTANCTTVVFGMIRTLTDSLPLDWRVFVNGYLPRFAYDRGAVDTRLSFEALQEAAHISATAQTVGLTDSFSTDIRQNVPNPRQ